MYKIFTHFIMIWRFSTKIIFVFKSVFRRIFFLYIWNCPTDVQALGIYFGWFGCPAAIALGTSTSKLNSLLICFWTAAGKCFLLIRLFRGKLERRRRRMKLSLPVLRVCVCSLQLSRCYCCIYIAPERVGEIIPLLLNYNFWGESWAAKLWN